MRRVALSLMLMMGMVLCISSLHAHAQESAASRAEAQDARLGGDETQTRLIIDLSGSVNASVAVIEKPYRVIIDLPDVTFKDDNADEKSRSRGLVKGFRFGHISDTHSRVVVDVSGPVSVSEPEIIAAFDTQPARLVITLSPISEDGFRKQEAYSRGVDAARSAAEAEGLKDEPVVQDRADSRIIIVLDPGHGGIDVGARASSGEEEKDIVLAFARVLKKKLEDTGRYKVLLTRDSDRFITLDGRVNFARRQNAALFMSIHADSLANNAFGVRGATIYTLSERASDQAAALLAEKENLSDANAGYQVTEENDGVVDILFDLTQRETKVFSARFAHLVMQSVKGSMELNKNPMRSARFRVLRAYDVPSVLLELGYMSSNKDLALLTSVKWRDKAGQSLVVAIDRFFSGRGEAAVGSIPAGR